MANLSFFRSGSSWTPTTPHLKCSMIFRALPCLGSTMPLEEVQLTHPQQDVNLQNATSPPTSPWLIQTLFPNEFEDTGLLNADLILLPDPSFCKMLSSRCFLIRSALENRICCRTSCCKGSIRSVRKGEQLPNFSRANGRRSHNIRTNGPSSPTKAGLSKNEAQKEA